MRDVRLYAGERIDDLQFHGMKIIQRADAFRFGTDAVLLADFAQPKSRETAADLGTGTGAIALLMAMHHPNITVDAVELQPDIADMAWRSAYLNGMDDRVRVHHMDMRDAPKQLGSEKYSLVVCNPPYGRDGSAMVNDNVQLRTARHEGGLTPDMVCDTAFRLLRYGGRFAVRAGLLQMLDNCAAGREGDLHHPGNLIPATQSFFQLQHSGQVHPVGQYQHRLCRYAFCPFYP